MRAHKILITGILCSLIGVATAIAGDPVSLPAPQIYNMNAAIAANTYENTAVVVWESAPDLTRKTGAVYACLATVAANGTITFGSAHKVSTSASNNGRPVIAFNPDSGNYMVAWAEYGNQAGIWVRELDNKAVPTGDAVEIISNYASEIDPRLVYIGDGDDAAFLLVYSNMGANANDLLRRGIWALKLDEFGIRAEEEWPVLLGDIYKGANDNNERHFVVAHDIAAAGGSAHIVSTMFLHNPANDTTIERGYVTWIKLSKNKVKNSQIIPDSSTFGRIAALGKRWTAVSWRHNDGFDNIYINQAFKKHKAKGKSYEAKPGSDNLATTLSPITGGAAMVYTISGSEMFLQKLNTKGLKTGSAKKLGNFNVFDLRSVPLFDGKQLLVVGVMRINEPANIQAFSVQLN